MKSNPLKGMKDYLPAEQRLRDHVQGEILRVYRASGFERIGTPILEDMENLDKSDGGDNLNLIFKVLKRGEKLEAALASGQEGELSDMGLRYDLTLPLSRYYAANRDKLPTPFKVIQTDRVFRAERPQKGRMREFVQCDIDIIGEESCCAEIELIDVTARALRQIGFANFTIHVNDRRLLRAMLSSMGFEAQSLDSVCVSFDKLDKIGAQGVAQELREKACPQQAVQALEAFLSKGQPRLEDVAASCEDPALAQQLRRVIDTVQQLCDGQYRIEYSPSLVRGQGYYTGIVFEVTCEGFAGAIAGGGRYDNMVGKFLGQSVPAVGFSIGFERICAILMEQGFTVPEPKGRLALLYRSEVPFVDVMKKAQRLREEYIVTILPQAKKLGKQLGVLESQGFACVAFADNDDLKPLGEER